MRMLRDASALAPPFAAVVTVFSVALALVGCGGGGGGGGDATTTAPPDPGCSPEQALCTHCHGGQCMGCPAGYGVDENATEGGACLAECLLPNYTETPPPKLPASVFELNGVRWPDMCINKSTAAFYGIGDWGGDGQPGQTWSNPGVPRPRQPGDQFAQLAVAREMKRLAPETDPDYVLNSGDNFYPGGISGHCCASGTTCSASVKAAADADGTTQFKVRKDDMYAGDGLAGKPWLSVLGNHDYGGFIWTAQWDLQIYRTWVDGAAWRMPGQYWWQKAQYRDFSIDYFFLESNFMDAHTTNLQHLICQDHAKPQVGCWNITSAGGCISMLDQAWKDSVAMLDKWLPQSTAQWRVLVTHFPGPAVAGHPDIAKHANDIDLIFTGHTHQQELGKTGDLDWIISGGGGGVTSEIMPTQEGNDNAYGFVNFEVTREEFMMQVHSWGGPEPGQKILRDRKTLKPKQRSSQETAASLVV